MARLSDVKYALKGLTTYWEKYTPVEPKDYSDYLKGAKKNKRKSDFDEVRSMSKSGFRRGM